LIVNYSTKSLLMTLSTFSMFLILVNLLICLLSHYIFYFSVFPDCYFQTETLQSSCPPWEEVIKILINISYIWFSYIIIKYSVLLGFTFFFIWWDIVLYILNKVLINQQVNSLWIVFTKHILWVFIHVFVRILPFHV